MLKFLKRFGKILLFVILAVLLVNAFPANDAIAVNSFMKDDATPLVASQSGCGSDYPANVMAAFNAASSYGVMYFSFGVVMTADEKLIVADTDDLNAYTSSSGKISETNYDQISTLNFAYTYQDADGNYPYRSQVLPCVTVDELFQSFPYSNFVITINMQGDAGKRAAVLLCELIRENDLSTRVTIVGDDTITNYVRTQTNVNVLTAPMNRELSAYQHFHAVRLDHLYLNVNFQLVQISANDVNYFTKNLIRSLQDRNVSVFMSDVNDESTYNLAKKMSVDGIITDKPELIEQLISTDSELTDSSGSDQTDSTDTGN
ncbi:MAG: glycerophosphodiester phosphodiesterase family protein [Anaerofustis sp.]